MYEKTAGSVAIVLVAAVIGTFGAHGGAQASGFLLPEASTAGIGTANAMVANPSEVGAIPYNAAAMGFQDKSSLALGALMIGPSFSVTNATGTHDSEGAEWVGAPLLQAAIKLNDQWRVGVGLNAPYGLETRWAYGTFPALSQSRTVPGLGTVPTGNHPTASKLEILDLVPTAAYRVNDSLSLALGLDIYSAQTAQLDSNLGQMEGSGYGLGFNLGVMYRINALSLGLTYRSAATLDIEGNYTPSNMALVAAGRLQQGQRASVDLNLPWRLQLGARYAFTDTIAAEFDWSYTGWEEFDRLEITGNRTGTLIFADTNAWSNSNAYRLGLTWQVQPQTQLRVGYAYDETGQSDDHFSARVPDSDRQLFGIGIAQELGNGFSVEASYAYVLGENRTVVAATPYTGGEVNGTSALDGEYEMDANIIGIELVKTF
ncbi:OmpP1/FadL family transporter [Lamprocystis purpurea]|jgi:long-chain fatty acid transport protein|uniref:OmpP1/FadL family transporter n=1 Tax=Lamprocystis purpurea TaxID=61598 RepID=UPI00036DCCD7|nr:outer membrane protein transport protein [Lamprocystis purpurea]